MQLRPPTLTASGRSVLVGACGCLLVATIAGRPTFAALGAVMLATVIWAWLSVREISMGLSALQLRLDLPAGPTGTRDRILPMAITLSHRGARLLRDLVVRLELSGAQQTPVMRLDLPALATGEVLFEPRFPRAGRWHLQGVAFEVQGALGLSRSGLYVPYERALLVRPKPLARTATRPLLGLTGTRRDRAGSHLTNRVGHGLQLRELRDYVPGDPLRSLAWRATARRGKPLVRAFEEESVRRIQLLVDIGPTMRHGPLGHTPLDQAIDLAAALAMGGAQDRIGLTTYDHRVYGHLKPSAGRPHLQRQLRHLMDLTQVVDEDLTESSEGELLARVGAWFERQQGLDMRRLGAGSWRRAQVDTLVDPIGELYDADALFAAVNAQLLRDRQAGHAALFGKSRPARHTVAARLRLFCALKGIALPYRLTGPIDAAETGLRDAVTRCLVPGAADQLIVLTDLRGLRRDGPAIRAIALATTRKKTVRVVRLGAFLPSPDLVKALHAARTRVLTIPTTSALSSSTGKKEPLHT